MDRARRRPRPRPELPDVRHAGRGEGEVHRAVSPTSLRDAAKANPPGGTIKVEIADAGSGDVMATVVTVAILRTRAYKGWAPA